MGLKKEWKRWRQQRRQARRRRVEETVARVTGGVVRSGPFRGLRYPAAAASGSVLAPKLLGTYEREIHAFVDEALARRPRRVLNLGAGEGYYAVGIALRLPGAEVDAFELEPGAREMCRALAQANGVGERLRLHGACTVTELRELTTEPALVICDVEGAERELLDPNEVPGLRSCEMIVEVHAVRGANAVADLVGRFEGTHRAGYARYARRHPREAAGVEGLSLGGRLTALNERRRRGLEWLHLVPLGPA